jgi:class 3 adenylate cyclase
MVTAMFTDIVDSTKLKTLMDGITATRRDAAFKTQIKQPHDQRILEHVRRAGGEKVKSTGDGFLFIFNDADEAVLCAVSIQQSLRVDPVGTPLGPLSLRIGIHTGSAQEPDDDFTAAAIDKAARVQAHAAPGEVFVSKETRVMVDGLRNVVFEELPPVELKGLGPHTLFRVVGNHAVEGEAKQVQPTDLAQLENPYDFSTAANGRTFKGRTSEMEELLDSIESGTHTAIFGLQRMGKTSLICQGLAAELETRKELRDRIVVANIDMQRLGGAQVTYKDFVSAILGSVVDELGKLGCARQVQNFRALTSTLFAPHQYQRGDRSEFFAVFTKVLTELTKHSDRRIILFLDEFSEIRKVIERNQAVLNKNPVRTARLLPHDLYIDVPFIHHLGSLLKDEALKGKITFIVLVRPFLAEYDEQQSLQLLKLMKPITLGRLDEPAAKQLITEPLGRYLSYRDDAVDYLIKLTAGHPYLLQFILKLLVDKIKRNGRPTIELKDVQWVEERMVGDGPGFDAQFAVLISDYSVDEVSHPKEALLGKGVLALISKLGQPRDGWATTAEIIDGLAKYDIPEEKTASLLSQLTRTRILEEIDRDDQLQYRLSVPLVRERFVRQNLYRKYFEFTKRTRRGPR